MKREEELGQVQFDSANSLLKEQGNLLPIRWALTLCRVPVSDTLEYNLLCRHSTRVQLPVGKRNKLNFRELCAVYRNSSGINHGRWTMGLMHLYNMCMILKYVTELFILSGCEEFFLSRGRCLHILSRHFEAVTLTAECLHVHRLVNN